MVSNTGFRLGHGASSTPTPFSAGDVTTLFASNSTGAFANKSQRPASDTTNGELFSSTAGSGSTPQLVATLTGHPAVTTPTQPFFIS